MRLAALLTLAALAPGCITAIGVAKHQEHVSVANLIETGSADLVVTTLVMLLADGLSPAGAIATGVAVTAADFGVACVLGTCQVLRP